MFIIRWWIWDLNEKKTCKIFFDFEQMLKFLVYSKLQEREKFSGRFSWQRKRSIENSIPLPTEKTETVERPGLKGLCEECFLEWNNIYQTIYINHKRNKKTRTKCPMTYASILSWTLLSKINDRRENKTRGENNNVIKIKVNVKFIFWAEKETPNFLKKLYLKRTQTSKLIFRIQQQNYPHIKFFVPISIDECAH